MSRQLAGIFTELEIHSPGTTTACCQTAIPHCRRRLKIIIVAIIDKIAHLFIERFGRSGKAVVGRLPVGSYRNLVGCLRLEIARYRHPLVGRQRKIALRKLMHILHRTAKSRLDSPSSRRPVAGRQARRNPAVRTAVDIEKRGMDTSVKPPVTPYCPVVLNVQIEFVRAVCPCGIT